MKRNSYGGLTMSKKNNKYRFFKGNAEESVADLRNRIKQNYINKTFNVWMSKFEWEGLDEGIAAQQENFIMRKFWSEGTIGCRQVEKIGTLVFAPYAGFEYDLYDFPSKVSLINLRNAPTQLIPIEPQVVGKEVVLGWCQPNHKSILASVNYYIDRLVQIDMVINTNLNLMKMPYLIGISEADGDRMKDIVNRILQDELVVFTDLEDLGRIQSIATNTPYIIDKLKDYSRSLESELWTVLGLDNNGNAKLEQTHVSIDAVNANNHVINEFHLGIESEINKWLDQINAVFGRKVTIKPRVTIVESIHEEVNTDDAQTNN